MIQIISECYKKKKPINELSDIYNDSDNILQYDYTVTT